MGTQLARSSFYLRTIGHAFTRDFHFQPGSPAIQEIKYTYLLGTYKYDPFHTYAEIIAHEVPGGNGGFLLPDSGALDSYIYATTFSIQGMAGNGEYCFLYGHADERPLAIIWFQGTIDISKGFIIDSSASAANRVMGSLSPQSNSGTFK